MRCPECGYENREHYRFCGRCGAVLPIPEPVSETSAKPVTAKPSGAVRLSSPGLTDEPKRNLDYLLQDDEPHHGHGRMYVALALLLVAGALLFWHWRREGFPWAQPPSRAGDTTATPAPAAPASSPPPARNAPGSQRAAVASQGVSATAETAKGQPEQAQAPPASAAVIANAPTGVAQTKAAETAPPLEPASSSKAPSGEPADSSRAAATSLGPAESLEKLRAPATKPTQPEAPPPDVSSTRSDKLVAEGEKYLYGDGVPQNCARAQKNLTAAAKRLNAKAQSLLGTMYATGHCVNRDLPTAYRWYAKALHQDPGNQRVQQDLQVLWRQMNSDERQAALRTPQ